MAKKYGYLATIGADTSGLTAALKESDDAIKNTSSELREINKALKLDPTNAELIAQKYEVLGQQLDATRAKAKSLEQSQSDAAKALANNPAWEQAYEPLNKQLIEAKKNLTELKNKNDQMKNDLESGKINQTAYDEYTKSLDEAENAQKNVQKQIRELKKEFKDMGGYLSPGEYRKYSRELEQARIATAQLEKETKDLDGATDQSSKAFRKAVESTKEYQQAMDKLSASAGDLKSKVGGALNDIWNIALKVGTAITSAAVAAGAASTKIGADFDASMSTVEALSRATGNELDTLREKAKEMGATTSKTAKESADALGYMALAGWDTQQMLEGLEPILRASEAGNMELATASDLVTDSMSAMGVSVNDLTHYLDVATKAQSSSNTSLEQMLNAYVIAGGAFKNFNVSLEESATLLGVLANRGIKGSEAGNALNSVLINLIGANKNAASAMDALGVSAYDADGKFIGITETLKLVASALENVNDQDKAIFTAKIGGKTQYDTLQALLSGVNEEYDTLLGKIEDSNGALEETAKIMRDNLKGDVTTLKSAFEDLGIEVNDQFTDAFREAVQVTTKEVAKLSNAVSDDELGESLKKIAEAFAKAIEQIAKFAADKAIPDTVEFFDFIVDNGPLVKGLIVSIASAFAAFKIIGTINGIWGKLVDVIKDYNNALVEGVTKTQAMTAALGINPWVLLASAIAVVVAGIAEYVYESSKASKKLQEVAEENIQAYEEQAEKVENIETELENTSLKIDEIKNKGKLSLVDEKAIEQLQTQNDKLAAQLEIEKELLEIKRQQNELTLYELVDSDTISHFQSLIKDYDYATKMVENAQETLNAALASGSTGKQERKDLNYWKQNALDAKQQITDEINTINDLSKSLDMTTESGKETAEIISEVNKMFSEKFTVSKPKAALPNFSENIFGGIGEGYGEAIKEVEDNIEDGTEDLVEKLKEEMDDLDFQKNIHQIDDATYWNERRRVLNTYLLKESEEWWKYYDETEEYFAKQTEEEKKIFEQDIQNKAEALKEKKELNDDYTEEMYYDELEILISTLDKESDLYKKYNSEILKGRKDLKNNIIKEAKETAEKQATELEKAYDEIKKQKEQVKSELQKIDLTETVKGKNGEDVTVLKDLDAEIKKLDKYETSLKKLEATGISDSLMAEINKLDYSSGARQDYIDTLLSIPEDKLQLYYADWNRLQNKQEEVAQNAVSDQLDELNDKAAEGVKNIFGNIPSEAYAEGVETARQYLQGIIDSMGDVDAAAALRLGNIADRAAVQNNPNLSSTEKLLVSGKLIPASTPINIILDSKKYVETTIGNLISKGQISGGNVFNL